MSSSASASGEMHPAAASVRRHRRSIQVHRAEHVIREMDEPWGLNHALSLETGYRRRARGNRSTVAEHERTTAGQLQLVSSARPPGTACTAFAPPAIRTLEPCRLIAPVERRCDPLGDEEERRAVFIGLRLTGVMREHEDACVGNGGSFPPSVPCGDRRVMRAGPAAEHVAPHDVGADVLRLLHRPRRWGPPPPSRPGVRHASQFEHRTDGSSESPTRVEIVQARFGPGHEAVRARSPTGIGPFPSRPAPPSASDTRRACGSCATSTTSVPGRPW